MRGWEKIQKRSHKNEKHKIKRITARRGKSRENAKRKKTIQVFPILNWNRWRGYYYPQSENIFRRRRDEKIMPNGKKARMKKPHYNLIKNLNVKQFRWRQRNLAFRNNAKARQKVCRTFIKRQRQAGFSLVCLFFFLPNLSVKGLKFFYKTK